MKRSFDRLTGIRDGAARTASGCSELPGSGLFETSTFSSRSSSGCECRASICLDRNAVLAEELRRTFPEIDRIERELGKAAKAIQSVSALVVRYRERLRELCDTAASAKIAPKSRNWKAMFAR